MFTFKDHYTAAFIRFLNGNILVGFEFAEGLEMSWGKIHGLFWEGGKGFNF